MIKAILLKTDGSKIIKEYDNLTLEDIQGAVGGLYECVQLPKQNVDMLCNEEGKMTGLEQNPIATAFYHSNHGPYDVIVGDVLLINGLNLDGEYISLTDKQIEELMAFEQRITLISPNQFNYN